MGSKQYKKRIYSAPRSSSRISVAIIAALLVMAIGLTTWKAFTEKGSSQGALVQATKKTVGKETTEGLRKANASNQNNDLTIVKSKDILGDKTLPSTAKAGEAKVSIDIVDSKGRSYGGSSDFQINTEGGKRYETVSLIIKTENLAVGDCTVIHKYITDDAYTTMPAINNLESTLRQNVDVFDGVNSFKVDCPTKDKTLSTGMFFRIADHQPQKCSEFSFADSEPTAATVDDLRSGVVGNWEGCVKTPWAPAYYVSLTLNADGTYSAVSDEVLDGVQMNALYYGTEQDSPEKTYSIDTFSETMTGGGVLNIVFNPGEITLGTLSNIKLMGDHLSFDFLHANQYGPISFQLYRK